MLTARFILSDKNDEQLIEKKSLGLIFNWLMEKKYFEDNPDVELFLTEENTKKELFYVSIKKETTMSEVKALWEPFERGF